MEGLEEQNNIFREQEARHEKFVELLDVIDSLSEKLDSHIAGEFLEYLDEQDLLLEKYFLANVFISRITKGELPEASNYELYDTEDGKIQKYIMNLAETQEIAA